MNESTDSESVSSSLPECPHCGTPVADVTITGPMDQYASPCGCRIHLGELESDD